MAQVQEIIPTGLVSYKYSTRKGLSTKVLATFDVAMPQGVSYSDMKLCHGTGCRGTVRDKPHGWSWGGTRDRRVRDLRLRH